MLPAMTRVLAALALGSAFLACTHSPLKAGVYEDRDVRYALEPPGQGWEPLDVAQANLAWTSPELAASLLVNSHCRGIDDAPLPVLTRHLLIGMRDVEVLSERRLRISRREALESVVKARLDGVERRLVILVLKKDGCVYDIVLDASPATFERALPHYERVRGSFHVYTRKVWS